MKGHNLLLTYSMLQAEISLFTNCYLQGRTIYVEHQDYALYKWVKFLMMVLLSHVCTLFVS
jgi:hypothetical protein